MKGLAMAAECREKFNKVSIALQANNKTGERRDVIEPSREK